MTLRAGIIGLGVGESHIAGYRAHRDCRVTALCDFNPRVLRAAQRKYPGLKLYARAEDLIKDKMIDVVSIASYDDAHYNQIKLAIKSGKHVFVEKPVCTSERHARDLYQLLLKAKNICLSSNLILRLSPRFQWLKKTITDNRLGQLYYVEGDYNYGRLEKLTKGWRGQQKFYSIIYGGGVHMVDLLHWLTGDRIVRVAAVGNRIASRGTQFKYNDCVVSQLEFKKGAIGKLTCNFSCVSPHFHRLDVYGMKATFRNDWPHAYFIKSRNPRVKSQLVKSAYPGVKKGDLIFNFVQTILRQEKPLISKRDIFDTMSVCFAIEKATHKKTFVKVSYF